MSVKKAPSTLCEDCGEHAGRRFRCVKCGLLVCAWCIGHVHYSKADTEKYVVSIP